MTPTTIGLLHPGAMGSRIGAAAKANGADVLWVPDDRSEATQQRADDCGLETVSWLNALVNRSDIVISVCPPHAAEEVARQVSDLGFRDIYVDANAIAPATARRVAEIVEAPGATFVDGGIVGSPPRERGTTRMYLSGEAAQKVARAFEQGPLEAIPIAGSAGAASALKMSYAAYTKGSTALIASILAVATREGVAEALLAEWRRSQPALAQSYDSRVRSSADRAWRFVGEMEEIAATFQAAGLPPGFHQAAAELFGRLAEYKDAPDPPPIEQLITTILRD